MARASKTAFFVNTRLGDGVKYFMLEVEDWTQPPPQATSPRPSESSRPGQQRAHTLSGSILPARSSPSNGTKVKSVGRTASDGGTLQGQLNSADPGSVGAGKSGPGEARVDPSGVPPIAKKDTDEPKEGSSKGLSVNSVGHRRSATTSNTTPSPPSSPPTIRASTSLLSTSLRQPLPRPLSDSEDEDDRSQPLRHSAHVLARSPPGPFLPLLDPIVQGQRAPSPKRSTPSTAGLGRTSTSLVPSTPTTPTAEVSKVFVEGGTSPRLDKGKGKELPPSATNTSTATGTPGTSSTPSAQPSPRLGGLSAPSFPPSLKQSKNQPSLSSSPLRVSLLAGESSPSPSSSSTRSRARHASATPLAVPFSGRNQSSGLAGKRPLSVGMPGGFDQAMLSTSPPSTSKPSTRDMNTSISNMSKARASVAVTSELEAELGQSTALQARALGLSSVSENEPSNESSSTRPDDNVSEATTSRSGGGSNLRGLNGEQGQKVETEEAGRGGGGGSTSVSRNVGNANTQTERRGTTSMLGTAGGGGWLGGWTFGRRTGSRTMTGDNGGDAGSVAALLKRYNEGT